MRGRAYVIMMLSSAAIWAMFGVAAIFGAAWATLKTYLIVTVVLAVLVAALAVVNAWRQGG